jgi:hypothetical protein
MRWVWWDGAQRANDTESSSASFRGRIVELACNCYGCHVLQKALDCEEEVRLLIVSELLLGDPAQTLVNKHASHVWSKVQRMSVRNLNEFNKFVDNGVDVDAPCAANLYIVRLTSFQASAG